MGETIMVKCDQCGNAYGRALPGTLHNGISGSIDSVEYAIAKMAPFGARRASEKLEG